ncbi:MAG: hypothetical protein KatS3mg101_0212 [Patescibacteria group bacterium]|nr:MAG: hypothetical protein KatS3mg101_0212 [Patescibacteria group bacterium]
MNLTKTAILFRRFIKISMLVLGVYYGWMFFGGPGLKTLVKIIYQTKEPPNPIYGNLDPLEFVAKEVTGDQVYKLNTKNGRLPGSIPYKMNVYKFKPRAFSYLAGDNAMKDAELIGYENQHLISDLKGTVYKWRRTDTNSYLEIDINTRRIFADSDIVRNSARLYTGKLDDKGVINSAVSLFSKLDRIDELYKEGVQKVTYGYVGGTKLYQTNAQRDTVFARVDLYRKLNDYIVLGPDPKIGLLNTFVTSPKNEKTLVLTYPKISAYYREIETKTNASYPIIDVSTAWNAVKNGKGVITSVVPAGSSVFDKQDTPVVSEILVDNIYLAYYENPDEKQLYLQPIYVFDGKYKSLGSQGGEITIYLPAISGQYVKPIAPQNAPATPVTQ